MKAIILASGIGKRLSPLTDNIPKPLLKLNGKTIIEKQIDALLKNDIVDILITTGPFEEEMINFLEEKYEHTSFTFVNNPQYDSTNYIYSLWLTKDHINDDILLIHGDLIFEEKLLSKMLKSNDNLVLVNKEIKIPEKDFKAIIEEDYIKKIGVDLFTDNSYFLLPLYKFNQKDFMVWMDEIENEIKAGNLGVYAENAFNKISEKLNLRPLYFTEKACMEIDTKEDLVLAKKLLKKGE